MKKSKLFLLGLAALAGYFLFGRTSSGTSSVASWQDTWAKLTPGQQSLVTFISNRKGLALGDALAEARSNPLWSQGDAAINGYLVQNA